MRALAWGFVSLFLALSPALAAPAGVYLLVRGGWNEDVLGAAIRGDFARGNVPLLAQPSADALVASVPDGLEHDLHTQSYRFTVAFYWHGARLGESDESCDDKMLADCAAQFLLDTKSALDAAH